ncbi:MAG: hypothetical protein COC19_03675 [SAR86 cluster bacterium]|uniref:Uncharacterized protein n=1 Tax=SAR86 cluster bacterium TaxID=2030880 RepID=A0A2A4MPE2_9GAMM|nr:MAG: hypothetical protein COC19_03675 [SAR86 cluster bacterium]
MKYIWHFYIFLFLAFGVARLVERLLKDSGGFSSQYSPLIVSVIFSLGVYGSINQKPLFKLWFWKSFYWLSLILSVSLLVFATYLLVVVSSLQWPVVIVLAVIFIIPAQVKIRIYAFKSQLCW